MDIRSLPVEIRSHIRSGINISCFGQCVTELVLNCLDAKATAIAVRINFLKFKVQVVDNGIGISESNMKCIGVRYMTNKCSSLNDFKEKHKYYGYRGEFLASVKELSKKMIVTSRCVKTNTTCSKVFENNVEQIVTAKQRPGNGTTITIEELFYNQPVRQRRVNGDIDTDEIKRCLECLSVIHPNVSFSLRNDVTGNVILNCHKTKSVAQAFTSLYSHVNIDHLHEIKVVKDNISISGLLYTQLFDNNKLQLIYVNKRPVHLAKLQKVMNDVILKKYNASDDCGNPSKNRFVPQVKKNNHLVYVINIICPYSEVEFILNSTKCLVEFKSWNVILKCIHKMLDTFEEKYINSDKCLNRQPDDDLISLNEKKRSLETVEKQANCKALKSSEFDLTDMLNKVKVRKKSLGLRKAAPKKMKCKNVFEQPINSQCLTLDDKNDDLFCVNQITDANEQIDGWFDDDVVPNLTLTDDAKIIRSNSLPEIIDKSNNIDDVEHIEKTGKDYIMNEFIKSIGVINSIEKCDDDLINIHDKDRNNMEIDKELYNMTGSISEVPVVHPKEPNLLHDLSFVNVGLRKRRLEKINSVGNIIIANKLDNENKTQNLPINDLSDGKEKSNMTSKCVQTMDNDHIKPHDQKLLNTGESKISLDPLKTKLVRSFSECEDSNTSKYFESSKKRNKNAYEMAPPVKRTITEKESVFNQNSCKVYDDNIPLCKEIRMFSNVKPTSCGQETKRQLWKNEETFQSHCNILQSKILNNTLCTNETYDEPVINESIFYDYMIDAKQSKNKMVNITINSKALADELSLTFPKMQDNKESFDMNYNKFKEYLKNEIKCDRMVRDCTLNLKYNDARTEISEPAQNITLSKYFINDVTNKYTTLNVHERNQRTNMNFSIAHIDTSCFMRGNCDFYPQIETSEPNENDDRSRAVVRTLNCRPKSSNDFAERMITLNINDRNFNVKGCDVTFPDVQPCNEFEMRHENNTEEMDFEINDLTFCNFYPQFKSTQNEKICTKLKSDYSDDVDNQSGEKQNEWVNQRDTFGTLFYLNTRTGMTSYTNPMFESNFTLKKRVEFIPKGLSPILVDRKQCDTSLSPSSRKKLTNAVIENYQRELNTVKWEKYIEDEDSDAFFVKIYNEKCKQCEGFVPDITKNNLPGYHKQIHGSHTFTKDVFVDLNIIGQMDCKFIVTLSKSNLLILFDQHAVHERIRLEELMQEYTVPNAQGLKAIKFQSMTYKSGISVKFSELEISMLTNYRTAFENLGLTYNILKDEIVVRKVPSCFYKKSEKSENRKRDVLRKLIRTLINEEIEMIQTTRGLPSNIPECLQDVINSEACRGAIKFGEQITREECVDYIRKLSNCNLPFQCAHGRPTLVPILLIEEVRDTYKTKTNLKALFH